MSEFSKRLKILLIERKITNKELAEHLALESNSISNYVTGKRAPNLETVVKIAKFLNISADYLLGITNNPNMPNIQIAAKADKQLSDEQVHEIRKIVMDVIKNNLKLNVTNNGQTDKDS